MSFLKKVRSFFGLNRDGAIRMTTCEVRVHGTNTKRKNERPDQQRKHTCWERWGIYEQTSRWNGKEGRKSFLLTVSTRAVYHFFLFFFEWAKTASHKRNPLSTIDWMMEESVKARLFHIEFLCQHLRSARLSFMQLTKKNSPIFDVFHTGILI